MIKLKTLLTEGQYFSAPTKKKVQLGGIFTGTGFKHIQSETISKSKLQSLANKYGLNIDDYDIDQLRVGYEIEKEHNDGSEIDVVTSEGDLLKIAMAHLNELPDYYTRLRNMEMESINHSWR